MVPAHGVVTRGSPAFRRHRARRVPSVSSPRREASSKRDCTDRRYSSQQPLLDDDAREAYEAFLAGQPLPGRENG